MKTFILVMLLGSAVQTGTAVAGEFGMLPIPAFGLIVPYPNGWQSDVQMDPNHSFLNLTFTVKKNSETPQPQIALMMARNTAAMSGMAGLAGGAKAFRNMPNVPGVGGRWSQVGKQEAAPPNSQSGSTSTGANEENSAKMPPPEPASNKTIFWLGQKSDVIDSTSTAEEGKITKTRMVSAMLPDKTVMMSCSAPAEEFTPAFSQLCNKLIKNVKRVK